MKLTNITVSKTQNRAAASSGYDRNINSVELSASIDSSDDVHEAHAKLEAWCDELLNGTAGEPVASTREVSPERATAYGAEFSEKYGKDAHMKVFLSACPHGSWSRMLGSPEDRRKYVAYLQAHEGQ